MSSGAEFAGPGMAAPAVRVPALDAAKRADASLRLAENQLTQMSPAQLPAISAALGETADALHGLARFASGCGPVTNWPGDLRDDLRNATLRIARSFDRTRRLHQAAGDFYATRLGIARVEQEGYGQRLAAGGTTRSRSGSRLRITG